MQQAIDSNGGRTHPTVSCVWRRRAVLTALGISAACPLVWAGEADRVPISGDGAEKAGSARLEGDAEVEAAPSTWDKILENEVVQAFTQGKFSLNARLRWEHADQEGLKASDALTIRPRLGFTTAPIHGLQGMLEAENVTSLGAPYNPSGLDPDETDRTVVADPEATEINQAWLSYSRYDSVFRGGRQRIVLDNQRFIGDVGWRQNQQTFDGLMVQSEYVEGATFFYGYLSRINRVLGDGHPQGNWRSDSHLLHASYALCQEAKLTGYGYLLDFDNAPASSSTTVGGSLTGSFQAYADLKLDYRAELAWQADYRDNPNNYDALYYNLELTSTYRRWLAGAGYEVLGSDKGASFQTPLATLHKFNGWADSFLTTPADGLQDLWGQVGYTLPWELPLRVVYHKFWAEDAGRDYGQEIDAVVSRKFGTHFSALAKYAYYDSASDRPNIHRFWLQAEFNY